MHRSKSFFVKNNSATCPFPMQFLLVWQCYTLHTHRRIDITRRMSLTVIAHWLIIASSAVGGLWLLIEAYDAFTHFGNPTRGAWKLVSAALSFAVTAITYLHPPK